MAEKLDFSFITRIFSEVKILIVGRSKSRRLDGKLRMASRQLNEPLCSYFLTRVEFETHSAAAVGFLPNILREPWTFVVGNDGELR